MSHRIVVVGGGITGLTAGYHLARADDDLDVLVLEADDHLGGKLGIEPVGPLLVDTGADGFLAREPEMTELCTDLGLGDRLASPRGQHAYLWVDHGLRRIPPSLLGVPTSAEGLEASGIVSSAGIKEFRHLVEIDAPPSTDDVSVGQALRPRVGTEVFERLIDPLLGGINAGSADDLSIRSGAARLADVVGRGGALLDAVSAVLRSTPPGPVFHGIEGGTGTVVHALADALGDRVTTGTRVTAIERSGPTWIVATDTGTIDADAIVLAAPGPAAGELLRRVEPHTAATLQAIELASVALVTFVLARDAIDHPLDGNGFLVPKDQGLMMTACSWASSKWAHYDDGRHAVLRVSAGRTDDSRWTALGDDDLVTRLTDELSTTIGLHPESLGPSLDFRVNRWFDALPQYRPGHLDRLDAVDRALSAAAPGLVVAGASCRGLGLPACARQARGAADRVLEHLA